LIGYVIPIWNILNYLQFPHINNLKIIPHNLHQENVNFQLHQLRKEEMGLNHIRHDDF
jgi:hypothetical protein